MAILKFSTSAVAAQIAHARACKTFLSNWNGPMDRPALILIGETYEVPSGLGGTFRVIVKDACDTFAIVQNCGNSAFWEYEEDEAAPMSRERGARQGIGASAYSHKRCEDFDAMQPYRVPLDALTEIDDRRVA